MHNNYEFVSLEFLSNIDVLDILTNLNHLLCIMECHVLTLREVYKQFVICAIYRQFEGMET